ncbi:multidrug resistance-associated protein 1-like [Sycon ciliatum]|uniref:multidrug resistance-associated protein 1-like n=1 Tax=Sycon ciliatum TaxID=27933 RepID=UPI0031F693FA
MDSFCKPTPYYSPPAVVNTTDFTLCFEDTIILWIPCGFLWLFAALRFCFASPGGLGSIAISTLHKLKLLSGSCVFLLSLIRIGHYVHSYGNSGTVYQYEWYAAGILAGTVLFSLVLTERDRRVGNRTSGVMFFFWLMLTGYFGILLRSHVLIYMHDSSQEQAVIFYTVCIFPFFSLVSTLLAAFNDHRPPYSVDSDANPCPEQQATFLSRITFWWIYPLLKMGYKRPLKRDDLWSLNDYDKSSHIVPLFERAWDKQLKKIGRSAGSETHAADIKAKGFSVRQIQESEETTPLIARTSSPGDQSGSGKAAQPSLIWALGGAFGWTFAASGVLKLVNDVLAFVNPQILKLLIHFMSDSEEPVWHGYLYAGILFMVTVVQSIVVQQYFIKCMAIGMRVRTAVVSIVYKKSLRLSSSARRISTAGEIVNLMSVDAQRFMDLSGYLHYMWSMPLQIALSMYFLWQTMGVATLAGVGMMVLLIPVNAVLAAKTRTLQVRQMKAKDSRIKIMNEVLNGIKVIKLYAWEKSFLRLVGGIRENELQVLKDTAFLNAGGTFTWTMAPFLVALVTFGTYSLAGNELTASKAFVALSLFNILKFPLSVLPMMIAFLVESSVSLGRLNKFMRHDDLKESSVKRESRPPTDGSPTVSVRHGKFSWGEEEPAVLSGINLSVRENELLAVVGSVGAGKSSLLSALLGDMDKLDGTVTVKGRVAFVPQQAWIQNATVRDNILFGRMYNQAVYQKVINACALGPDLEMLPGGDMTEIGEKGINLSGGQKQRVSLARAVYSNADIYLLDDPLSAVDSHVGKHIFENVIGPNGVLKHKVRIFNTHQITLLPQCDGIIVLKEGFISESGTYNSLVESRGAFSEYLQHYAANEEEDDDDEEEPEETFGSRTVPEDTMPLGEDSSALELGTGDVESFTRTQGRRQQLERQQSQSLTEQISLASPPSVSRQSSSISPPSSSGISRDTSEHSVHGQHSVTRQTSSGRRRQLSKQKSSLRQSTQDKTRLTNEHVTLIEEESSEEGRVKLSVLILYLKALRAPFSAIILMIYILSNGCSIGTNIWLAHWSAANTKHAAAKAAAAGGSSSLMSDDFSFMSDNESNSSNHTADLNTGMYLGVYASFGLGQGLLVLAGSFILALASVGASRRLHRKMLRNVLRSPMSFFDTTPLGRVVNRFSKDVYTIDEAIPRSLRSFLMMFFNVLSILIVISYSSPIFLGLLAPLSIVYFVAQRYYVTTSRQLKRLESVSRSPVYSHFSETLSGVSTIRAYNAQERFTMESEHRVDVNQAAYYPNLVANRWLAVQLEFVGGIVVLGAALFAVVDREVNIGHGDGGNATKASLAGLSVSYALSITAALNWMVRMSSELETNLVSVERVKEYSETPTEAPDVVEGNRPDPRWPMNGEVVFDRYKTRYRPGLDLVVKGISANIKGGEKVGIVGRTGAGKSSLTLALFRLIEAASGSIIIDGIDIARLGLEDLRSRLTIIPQDPVLFSGTLRFNLDPFEEHSDVEVWNSLRLAHLESFARGNDDGLQFDIAEGGENLSVGQRQLVCLARALLRKTKILVLDEATAAVDLETDDLIQRTIRTEFAHSTVFTIAHRLNTIMDYDRVMVLDMGKIIEYGNPDQLLSSQGHFYLMARDAGLVS